MARILFFLRYDDYRLPASGCSWMSTGDCYRRHWRHRYPQQQPQFHLQIFIKKGTWWLPADVWNHQNEYRHTPCSRSRSSSWLMTFFSCWSCRCNSSWGGAAGSWWVPHGWTVNDPRDKNKKVDINKEEEEDRTPIHLEDIIELHLYYTIWGGGGGSASLCRSCSKDESR